MSTLTIRLPDDKHLRLRELAKHRAISINKLMEELATVSIAEFGAETGAIGLRASAGRYGGTYALLSGERLTKLNAIAIRQMRTLTASVARLLENEAKT